tara:strand:+ start:27 stop:785 length:759 start_codon:yes stop_codon:yes gene_type:complete
VALTKVNRGGLNTGISDSSDATAITIDSSEGVTVASSIQFGSDAQTKVAGAGSSDVDLLVSGDTNIRFETGTNEQMRVDNSGRVLINRTSSSTVNPHSKLHVLADSAVSAVTIQIASNGYAGISFLNASGSDVGSIVINASSTAFNTSSDYRLKENVADMTGAIDRVKALAPKRFNFIADADTTLDGFLAHEAQAVVPEAVTGNKDAVDADDNPVYQGIDQSKLVPLLTGALKEAVAKIEVLEARVKTLEDA